MIITLLFPLEPICNRGIAKLKVIQKKVSLSQHTLYKNERADSGFLLSAECIDSSEHIILHVIQDLFTILQLKQKKDALYCSNIYVSFCIINQEKVATYP